MSDGDSVTGQLKDLGKETVKGVLSVPKSIIKATPGQVLNQDSEEKEAKKRQEKTATYYRIKEIEAEIAAIRRENEKKQGPEVIKSSETTQSEDGSNKKTKAMDETSRQAVGRAEQGRNFKG